LTEHYISIEITEQTGAHEENHQPIAIKLIL